MCVLCVLCVERVMEAEGVEGDDGEDAHCYFGLPLYVSCCLLWKKPDIQICVSSEYHSHKCEKKVVVHLLSNFQKIKFMLERTKQPQKESQIESDWLESGSQPLLLGWWPMLPSSFPENVWFDSPSFQRVGVTSPSWLLLGGDGWPPPSFGGAAFLPLL